MHLHDQPHDASRGGTVARRAVLLVSVATATLATAAATMALAVTPSTSLAW